MGKENQLVSMITDKNYILETKALDVFYGEMQALKNINMHIERNKVTAFIGPSGCGKSTFLRVFNRMNDYIESYRMEGEVFMRGENIYDKNIQVDELRKNIGMVFQKPNPFPKSIYDNVTYGLVIQGITDKSFLKERVEKSLDKQLFGMKSKTI